MSRVLRLCPFLLRHRTAMFSKPGRRLTHSENSHNQELSPTESAVGLAVFFMAFLAPAAYMLSNLSRFKGD
ncbi:cytochrome c oxidase subunit 8C, mitochondrial [Acomys russatus]|uniref:cytochrome c oxidase subunit 8C, mitochondrial n=1 Tax=Acomys russatus TaxID=60746 RepID=UPI0021E265FA|nr:cytochrome c oxidase subunit 8C, mitochondrial [Acomys russatus]